jgi:hypothetical protein
MTGVTVLLSCITASIGAVPVVRMGQSGDNWERTPSGYDENADCEQISENQFTLMPPAQVRPEVLERSDVFQPRDRKIAKALHLRRPVAEAFLASNVKRLEENKHQVYEEKRGSWSRSDQIELDRLKDIIHGPKLGELKPYFVRAFQWWDRDAWLSVYNCGGYARTAIYPRNSGVQPKPTRAVMLVFLPAAPRGSFAWWGQENIPEHVP